MEIFIIIFKTIFFYAFIFFIYKIMGKREVGQLGIIDLIVSILISELAVMSIENVNDHFLNSIAAIITLALIQVVLSFLSLKHPKFRNFLDGNPSVIIDSGKLNYKEMVSQKYNLDDLLTQLREKGFKSIEDVEYAILENNGKLSIFPFQEKVHNIPLPIILDRQIQEDTLTYLKKNKKWVYNLLEKKNINLEEVFYAFYKDKNIFIIKQSDLK